MLTLKDLTFEIDAASFYGIISRCSGGLLDLSWHLEFEMEEKECEGIPWDITISSSNLRISFPNPCDLENTEFIVPNNDQDEDSPFLFTFLEHDPVYDAGLQFGVWHENLIDFKMQAKTNPQASEDYDTNIDLVIALALPFKGIFCTTYSYEAAIGSEEAQDWLRQVGLCPESFSSLIEITENPSIISSQFCFLYSKGASA
ncbi:hypothetical protein [Armatimonas rosea]|uniref:Uncharacterized protein n=1 Tax=Armatimonas rosea TaxID=685828 RepID=A0A7W9SLB4_ARMRO|nr:hypothetical protein [Armatimonas rosea]MBB6048747.1 hypothetical protein [Armatimonas rosea]